MDKSKSYITALITFIIFILSFEFSTAQNVNPFIRQYIEGSGGNKAIELYNPTGSTINLAFYSIKISLNGGSGGTAVIPLTGNMAPQSYYVIANAASDPVLLIPKADLVSSMLQFNGDDAVYLVNTLSGTNVDIIGQIGIDPGTSWTVGTGSTLDHTLLRKTSVTQGITSWTTSKTQWDSYNQNDYTHFGNVTVIPEVVAPYRGVYIDSIYKFIGDTAKENQLLRWVQRNNFNAMSLYDLATVLGNSVMKAKLPAFIRKAKLEYGVKQIAAARGSSSTFTGSTNTYNISQTDTINRLNVYNLENEYWNGMCTYSTWIQYVKDIRTVAQASTPKIINEAYFGFFKNPLGQDSIQAAGIVKNMDRLLLHDYYAFPNYSYTSDRLTWLGKAAKAQGKVLKVIIIFSAETTANGGSDNFEGLYFPTHTFQEAYNDYMYQYNLSTFAYKNNIQIVGYQIWNEYYARKVRP